MKELNVKRFNFTQYWHDAEKTKNVIIPTVGAYRAALYEHSVEIKQKKHNKVLRKLNQVCKYQMAES